MQHFTIGNAIRVRAKFRDAQTKVLTDPTALGFKFINPDGAQSNFTYGANIEVVRESVGIYHFDINANASGRWQGRFWSDGTAKGARQVVFIVDESPFNLVGE